MSSVRDQLRALLDSIVRTAPEEIDCEAFLDHAAVLLEALASGDEVPSELETVSQHLKVCPECREEFEALIRAVGS